MKGIIIYEAPLWGDEENVVYLQEVKNASYTLKQVGSDDITCYLEGIATKEPVTKATCNKEDTYDFEMGALIALMKKCGAKKVADACCEVFPHETAGSMYREIKRYLKRIKELEEKVDNLYTYNKSLIDDIDKKNHEIISLKALKLTNESLKKDNESFRKTCENLKEENKRLNASIQSAYEIMVEKSADLMDKVKKLEEENEKLKLDCEKLQHGYLDQLDSLIEGSRAFTRKFDNEWYYRIPTKRDEMWDDILACDCEHSKYVKVKKEDLEAFVKECNEKKIFNIIGYEFQLQEYWFAEDSCIFQIFRKPAGFICAERLCYVFKDTIIDYLPPMRWDLFKKGRIAVEVAYKNYKEFYEACEKEFGKKPSTYPVLWDDVTISICKKDDNFEIFTMEDQKKTGRKIVNWEDVR